MKDSLIGLLVDCVYYCSQHQQITDEEDWKLNRFLDYLYSFIEELDISSQK